MPMRSTTSSSRRFLSPAISLLHLRSSFAILASKSTDAFFPITWAMKPSSRFHGPTEKARECRSPLADGFHRNGLDPPDVRDPEQVSALFPDSGSYGRYRFLDWVL